MCDCFSLVNLHDLYFRAAEQPTHPLAMSSDIRPLSFVYTESEWETEEGEESSTDEEEDQRPGTKPSEKNIQTDSHKLQSTVLPTKYGFCPDYTISDSCGGAHLGLVITTKPASLILLTATANSIVLSVPPFCTQFISPNQRGPWVGLLQSSQKNDNLGRPLDDV